MSLSPDPGFIIANEGYVGRPYVPGDPKTDQSSGVTLDYGYDLGQVTRDQFSADWGPVLAPQDASRLGPCVGLRGGVARTIAATAPIHGIGVTRTQAGQVFASATLPRYCELTLHTFPGLDALPKAVHTALVDLIYNRGASLDGPRRDEMRVIKAAVSVSDLKAIAYNLRKMARLWPEVPGLQRRCNKRAELLDDVAAA